jgi:hypothetical protein
MGLQSLLRADFIFFASSEIFFPANKKSAMSSSTALPDWFEMQKLQFGWEGEDLFMLAGLAFAL